MKRAWWVVVAMAVSAGAAFGQQQKFVPYIENPNWRPQACELLEEVTGNRYDANHVLDLRPESFDQLQIERSLALAQSGRFTDVNEEFECKYLLFRQALACWVFSTDDPSTEANFKKRYLDFQDVCRRLDGKHAFTGPEQEAKAEWVKDPFEVYRYFLFVYLDELALQLDTREVPLRPYTVAEGYMDYPCETNAKQLRDVFFSINRYFESRNYTWNRYIAQRKFQVARKLLYEGEWHQQRERYLKLLQSKRDTPGYRAALKEARQGAEFTYQRLRKEAETNGLPYFSDVNAMYLSHSLDDYFRKCELRDRIVESRKIEGKAKRLVVFIHGLGQDRTCWGMFPEMLALEDLADATLKEYYKVYVFQYTTEEKTQGVDDFVADLIPFIDDIKSKQKVDKVTLIAHSFGGVLSLRYMTSRDPKTGRFYRDNVDRFIGFAPSVHGSSVANVMVEMFGKRGRRFERHPPPFAHGMPFVGRMGDLQIRQNQLGSRVNLSVFGTLDESKCLEGIPSLTVVGDPFTLAGLFSPGGRSENDGLVKTYAANLNHAYLAGASGDRDIGYSGAEVRYANDRHFPLIKAMGRKHIGYRYATSFLKGQLLPQQTPHEFRVKYFLGAIKVSPAGTGEEGKFFLPRRQLSPDGKTILPEVRIKLSPAGHVKLHSEEWNPSSGVFFFEGHVEQEVPKGTVQVSLSADGFESKTLELPVKAGQVTYAVGLSLGSAASAGTPRK